MSYTDLNGLDPEHLYANILQSHLDALELGSDTPGANLEKQSRYFPEIKSEVETARILMLHGNRFSPSPGFLTASRRRLVDRIQQESGARAGRRAPNPFFSVLSSQVNRLAYQTALAVLVALVILSGTFGAAYAAQDALPGSQLYPLKRGIESVQLALTFDPASKVELHLSNAQARLDEAQQLAEQKGYEQLSQTIQDYQDSIDRAAGLIEQTDSDAVSGKMSAIVNGLPALIDAHTRIVQKLSLDVPAAQQMKVAALTRHLERKNQQIESFIARHTPGIPASDPELPGNESEPDKKPTHTAKPDKDLEPSKTPRPTKTDKPAPESGPNNELKPTKTEKPTKTPKP